MHGRLSDQLRVLLVQSGYRLAFRGQAWVDCLASLGGERWIGRGETEEAALEDLARRMFPSWLARELLARHLSLHDAAEPNELPLAPVAAPIPAPEPLAEPPAAAMLELPDPAPADSPRPNPEPDAVPPEPEPQPEEAPVPTPPASAEQPEPQLSLPLPLPPDEVPPPSTVPGPYLDAVHFAQASGPGQFLPQTSFPDPFPPLPFTTLPTSPAGSATGDAPEGTRVAQASAGPPPPRAVVGPSHLVAAGRTDRGLIRDKNHDAFATVLEHGLFLVAGGLGPKGDTAARLALETVRETFEAPPPRLRQQQGLPRLVAAIQRANTRIFTGARDDAKLRGMGTTLAAALVTSRGVALAHLGDARIYRLRAGVLELLSTDHSALNESMRLGKRPPPQTVNKLTRVLGIGATIEVDTSSMKPRPGDVLLLCSGGLHRVVSHDTLTEDMVASDTPEAAVARLVASAKSHGAPESVTALVIHVPAKG